MNTVLELKLMKPQKETLAREMRVIIKKRLIKMLVGEYFLVS